jgi:UDP-2,3-diacylglucosamine pyrophosphatase LpxH
LATSQISVNALFVSDIHLRSLEDSRGKLLLDLLARLDQKTLRFLVLNGDIFDFCFGPSHYFRHKFGELGAILQKIAAEGARVLLIEGNHEFSAAELGWDGVEVRDSQDITLKVDAQTTIAVCHGDLLAAPWHYRIFRRLIKSVWVSGLARLVPGRWLDRYALSHAKLSRAYEKPPNHKAVIAAAKAWLAERPSARHGVFGHFHVPYFEPTTNGGRLCCVKSWDEPNFLAWVNGGFKRAYWRQNEWQWEEPKLGTYD